MPGAADILRPPGALHWLDDVAAWIAGWQRRPLPRVEHPVGLVFAADHGVAAAMEVSALEPRVTAAMFAAFAEGRSTIRSFAPRRGDRGGGRRRIGKPTGDIRYEAAMSERSPRSSTSPGRRSTPSTATFSCSARWASATRGLGGGGRRAGRWGDGGVGRPGHRHRRRHADRQANRRAVAVRRIAGVTDPLDVLREVGGSELVAIAAAVVAARHRSLPLVLDGYVVTASVLPLVLLAPTVLEHCTVGHCSPGPDTGACSTASASARCSTSTCVSARAAGRWPLCPSSPWPAPASPRSPRSPSGSVDHQRLSTELDPDPDSP